MRNKLYFIILLIALSISFSGCGLFTPDYSGITAYEQVELARKNYAALDSGRLMIVDNSSGEITQDFIFKYQDDTLTYSYTVSDENGIYYEYHNGSEINYTDSNDTEWHALDGRSDQYFVKTRTDKHPLTQESAISINPDSIISGTTEQLPDGSLTVTYQYDIEKLASYADALKTIGSLTGFSSQLFINPEGYCTSLTQRAVLVDEFGKELMMDYTMTVTEMNSVEKVTRPVASWEN